MTLRTYDFDQSFVYENGFYLTSSAYRLGRALAHYELYKAVSHLEGAILECGVFRGVSLMRFISFAQLMPGADPSRKVIGFDTFGSFPETGNEEDKAELTAFIRETGGGASIGQQELESYIARKEFANAELVAGDICVTVPDYVRRNPDLKIALLNIDTDIVEPCEVILEHLAPRVVRGGVIAFDDYGVFPGETKLADAFAAKNGYAITRFPFMPVPHYLVVT